MTTGPFKGSDGLDDEVAAERLREVLSHAAASISPTDGSLGRVLARANQRTRWSWGAPLLAAATAVLLAAGVVTFAVGRDTGGGLAGGPSQTAPATSPGATSPDASSTGTNQSPSSTSTPAGTVRAVPVYYAATSNGQARLYREFHSIRSWQPAADAVRQLLGTAPTDADYMTLWPTGTTLVSYTVSGTEADVVLSGPPNQFPITAFQQIVYSVTAADPTVTSVRISYGAIALDPLTRAPATDVLAPVWLLAPAEGATKHARVTLSGTASVFEANVNWEIDRADGTRVASGSAVAPIGAPGRGPWSTSVTLTPGQYVAKAFEVSMKDGTWQWVDTKDFTVR